MKKLLSCLVAVLCLTQVGRAQTVPYTLDQSSSSTHWKTIENDFVKVIYPENFKDRAVYVANLVEHYSAVVGLSYLITKPKKVTLIIRDEMSMPNGFVALGPRRTEWFDSSAYSPIVGSTEWLQTLSIHEYRHVQQQDVYLKNTVRAFNVLFGDMGIALAEVFSKQSWMFEGDAVWSETKYTDGGRGRAPRFLARLKAILLAGETPTYDQFISGTYRNSLVDQYVYGYILISRAYQEFGEDFWDKMNDKLSTWPTPLRLDSAFKELTGKSFQYFYDETFYNLKQSWAKDSFPDLQATDYSVAMNPKTTSSGLYFVQYDMDHAAAIFKHTDKGPEKVLEIPYNDNLIRVDFSGDHAVYAAPTPHPRFGYKGYSDLTLVNLAQGASNPITSGERLYNPHFSQDGQKILASELTADQQWQLQEFDLSGRKTRTLKFNDLKLVEAVSADGNQVIAIGIDLTGNKTIISTHFGSDKYTTILKPSRNNIFSLQENSNNQVLFEAQYKGATEIFKVNTSDMTFAQCTFSKISSYAPTFDGNSFYYSEQTPYGNRLQKASLEQCTSLPETELVDFHYLGSNPSDSYNVFPPVAFPEQKELYTKNQDKYEPQDYSGFDARAFTPHSWNFFAARGFGVSVTTDNYLRDFGATVALGSDGEENVPFSSLEIDYKKYWPVFSLLGDIRNRKAELMGTDQDLTWRESSYGLGILLPYKSRSGIYNFNSAVGYSIQKLHTESYDLDDVNVPGVADSDYLLQTVNLQLSYAKDLTARSIISPWSSSLFLEYQDAHSLKSNTVGGSYRTFGLAKLTTPGLLTNHGFLLEVSGQKNREGTGNYIFPTPIFNPTGYVYSRGYDYKPADEFSKVSGNYLFPVAYPDYNLGLWIYVNRIYANLYYDHTKYVISGSDTNLNSFGAELALQSKILRFLPLDFGLRYIHEVDPSSDEGQFYVATQLGF